MVIKTHRTVIEIDLIPEYHHTPPTIMIGVDSVAEPQQITQPTHLTFDLELEPGAHSLIIDYVGKTNRDTVPGQGLDQTILIDCISFNGIQLDRFVWESTYTPTYPEPWFSQQTVKPPTTHQGSAKLGWNGRWQLNFNAPAFTWIHQIEKMGWIWPISS